MKLGDIMPDTAASSIGRGIKVNTLTELDRLGVEIATFCNESERIAKKIFTCKATIARDAAISEVSMMEFRQFAGMGDEKWGFGIQLGNSDRLWFCRVAGNDTVYRFEDSIFPQGYSEEECLGLIDYLKWTLENLRAR